MQRFLRSFLTGGGLSVRYVLAGQKIVGLLFEAVNEGGGLVAVACLAEAGGEGGGSRGGSLRDVPG